MSRKIIPFVVAFVWVCLVMAVAGVFSFSGAVSAQKFGVNIAWSKPYRAAESMKVIDLTGDGQEDLFVQYTNDVTWCVTNFPEAKYAYADVTYYNLNKWGKKGEVRLAKSLQTVAPAFARILERFDE